MGAVDPNSTNRSDNSLLSSQSTKKPEQPTVSVPKDGNPVSQEKLEAYTRARDVAQAALNNTNVIINECRQLKTDYDKKLTQLDDRMKQLADKKAKIAAEKAKFLDALRAAGKLPPQNTNT